MAILLEDFLNRIGLIWKSIRAFTFNFRTVFEFLFILIYSFEQGMLILSVYFFGEYIEIVVAIFAILVLTTFAVHKLIMESRIKLLEKTILGMELNMQSIVQETEKTTNDYDIMLDNLIESKNLNIDKPKTSKRGQK
tara:strand:+ start:67140 stop:67550 length:411 start_codon:yes stop_codon:yes gene_type:complete